MVRPISKIKFWALTASIAVHLSVLIVFALVKASPSDAFASPNPAPIAQVTAIAEMPLTIPKPKIKTLPQNNQSILKNYTDLLTDDQLYTSAIPAAENSEEVKNSPLPEANYSIAAVSPLSITTEFFGTETAARKLCYVVDCSGSMRGMFKTVQKNLTTSIQSLQPDHFFAIIFFGDDKLIELENGQMLRASPANIAKAVDFINSVQPKGQTNAFAALQRAWQVKDASSSRPGVIYFLTDGFELAGENQYRLTYKINNLIKQIAISTKVNTIGFWTTESDAEILKSIAQTSGGRFVNVTK